MRPPWTMEMNFAERPIFVCWETTKSCLLACRHCRAKAIRESLPGELDHEAGLKLIDGLLEFGEPYPALLFTGGDPLMRPDIFDLIGHAKDLGIYTAVAASVTPKLDEKAIKRMKELDVDIVSVSLDGASPHTHDRIRGIPGTWEKTIEAVRAAKAHGIRMQVNTTVMKSNVKELADIFHLVREAGAVAWEVFFLIRTGRGAFLEAIQPLQCEEVLHFLYEARGYGIPVRTSEAPQFRRVCAQRQNGGRAAEGELYGLLSRRLLELEGRPYSIPTSRLTPTGDGKGIVFVAYNGEVYPSGFLPIRLGTIPEEDLAQIYRSHPLMLALREPSKLGGRCGRCEFRGICGGSRSRAFTELGDPLEEDPACPYVPADVKVTIS